MMSSNIPFLLANAIKFGLPLGLLFGISRIVAAHFFFGRDVDVISTIMGYAVIGFFWGIVLGLIRIRSRN